MKNSLSDALIVDVFIDLVNVEAWEINNAQQLKIHWCDLVTYMTLTHTYDRRSQRCQILPAELGEPMSLKKIN